MKNGRFIVFLLITLMVSGLAADGVHATTVSIEEAVDNLDLSWTTGGNVAWSGQTTVYYYDGDSAQSGKISHSQNSWLSTTVDAGTSGKYLSFFWKVSSEKGFDKLSFSLDYVIVDSISGEVNWQAKSYYLSPGSHECQWIYGKDESVSEGSDAGWLDKVEVTSTEIPSTITITSPNGGERWVRGTTNTIRWTSTGILGTYVKIELLKGGVLNQVITASTVNDGRHSWLVPSTQALGADYRVRITSTANPAITDASDADFSITVGSLTVTSPNGGQRWLYGTAHLITWSYAGAPGTDVKIELVKGGEVDSVISSNTPNDRSYNWLVPSTQALGADYRVRITSTTDPAITDTSNADFSIIGALTLTTPNGGEMWVRGTTNTIRWTRYWISGAYVKIELLRAGEVEEVIVASTANDGRHSWAVPATETLASDYAIRITSLTDPAITDTSNADFSITPGTLVVTAPNTRESWGRGAAQNITWRSTGSPGDNIKIELLKGGEVDQVISSSTPNDGSYSWLIPPAQALDTDYRIRVTSTTYPSITDSSNANFAIALGVTSPKGGESWIRGTSHAITWTSSRSLGSYVKIELLKAGEVEKVITSSTANDGTHSWAIPVTQTPGTDYKVRVTNTKNHRANCTSEANFEISAGTLTVTSPNGFEVWVNGTTHSITWSYTGSPGTDVKIELLKGGDVDLVISPSTPNDRSYSWLVPKTQTFGTDYSIRITSNTEPSVTDTSNADFTIAIGSLTLTSPNGGQYWARGTAHTITWTYAGHPGDDVTIELLSSGELYRVIVLSTPNDRSYSWVVPLTVKIGSDYRIRITSTTDPSISDMSNISFSITS